MLKRKTARKQQCSLYLPLHIRIPLEPAHPPTPQRAPARISSLVAMMLRRQGSTCTAARSLGREDIRELAPVKEMGATSSATPQTAAKSLGYRWACRRRVPRHPNPTAQRLGTGRRLSLPQSHRQRSRQDRHARAHCCRSCPLR